MDYIISGSELEDFVNTCNKRGLSEYDFEFDGHGVEEIKKIPFFKNVTIARDGKSKTYSLSDWLTQVIYDIEAGFFD